MKFKELNEAEAALQLIEQFRLSALVEYQNPLSQEMKDDALMQLDRIDRFINKYFGKQKWELIQKDL